MHDVTTEPGDGLTVTEALDLAARDRDVLLERLKLTPRDRVTDSGRIIHGPSLYPTRTVTYDKRDHRYQPHWRWECTDPADCTVLAAGWAFYKSWAEHRAHVVAGRIYDQRVAAKAKAAAKEANRG